MANSSVELKDFARAWLFSLIGFIAGVYGGTALLDVIGDRSGVEAMLELAWLPWLLAPTLSSAGAILGLFPRCWGKAKWTDWLKATLVMPTVMTLVIIFIAWLQDFLVPRLWIDLPTLILVAGVLGLVFGLSLRARSYRGREDETD